MNELTGVRRAIRPLLREQEPADAMAAYYAFYHPDEKTTIHIVPEEGARAEGFITLSRTGIDLFRPLVTLRLPIDQGAQGYSASLALLRQSLTPGLPIILASPQRYMPLIRAIFMIQGEEAARVYVLDPGRFEPIVNVMVTESTAANGLPRFAIVSSQSGQPEVVAAATLNWMSPYFGEIAVTTKSEYRRRGWGRSVVAAMSQHLLDSGRTPLYTVADSNAASIQLAEKVGFVDSGAREFVMQAALSPVKEA